MHRVRGFHSARAVLAQQNHYEVLGVSVNASQKEIKKRFYALSRKYHPDRQIGSPTPAKPEEEQGNLEKYQQITAAYAVLSNEQQRRKFNETLGTAVRRPEGYSAPRQRRPWQGTQRARSGFQFTARYEAKSAHPSRRDPDLDPLRPRAGHWDAQNDVRHFDFEGHRQRHERYEAYRHHQAAAHREFMNKHAPPPPSEGTGLGSMLLGGTAAGIALVWLFLR